FDRLAPAVLQWLLGLGGPMGGPPTVTLANVRTTQGRAAPDLLFLLSAATHDARIWFPGIRKGVGFVLQMMIAPSQPQSRGSVTLRSSDPLAPPRIVYNFLTSDFDVEEMR